MRKLPSALENPLDNAFIALGDLMAPTLRALGHTPNMITTYSASCAALALVALHNGNMVAFAGLWLLHPFWDVLDGHYARKYGMTTRFGDFYDHATDTLSLVALGMMVAHRYDLRKAPAWLLALGVFLGAMSVVHLGCQQRYIGGHGETLDALQGACPGTSWLTFTRWFSHGTAHVFLVLVVLYLEKCCLKSPPPEAVA